MSPISIKMTKTVERDYETVEKEVTKYKCDVEGCENIVEEDEINTAFFVRGDEHKARPYPEDIFERRHVCEACSGLRTALQIREDKKSKTEYFREWWSATRVWLFLILPSFAMGSFAMRVFYAGTQNSRPGFSVLAGIFTSLWLQIIIAFVGFVIAQLIHLSKKDRL
mgnify:FL=1